MSPRSIAFACLALSVLALAGCAGHPARPNPKQSSAQARAAARGHATREKKQEAGTRLPSRTGIPACDDYLASYKACHRAAHIFSKGSLEKHYEMMRTSLLRQSMNPKTRKILPERCRSLAKLLHEALHGKSCKAGADAGSGSGS